MIQEPFAVGKSVIHTIDPRFRIVFAAIYSIVVAVSHRFPTLFLSLGVSILLVCLARLNIREVARRLAVVAWFLLLIWLVLPLSFDGAPLYHAGPLTITRQGVILSAQITIKSAAILTAFMALISTMTIVTLGQALNRLHLPGKLIHLLLMTYRYIFVIDQEYQRLWTAAKIRGFRSKTNIHSYKTYAYLIGMLFVRASTRAERVHQAMRCRGFKGKFFSLDDFSSASRNWFFAAIKTIIICSLIILEFKKYG